MMAAPILDKNCLHTLEDAPKLRAAALEGEHSNMLRTEWTPSAPAEAYLCCHQEALGRAKKWHFEQTYKMGNGGGNANESGDRSGDDSADGSEDANEDGSGSGCGDERVEMVVGTGSEGWLLDGSGDGS